MQIRRQPRSRRLHTSVRPVMVIVPNSVTSKTSAALGDPRSRHIDDPLLSIDSLTEAGRLRAGDLDPADPLVSPINAGLHGLPPPAVYAGSRDILYPDTVRLRDRARRENPDFTFDLRAGLVHGWVGVGCLPEAKAVLPRIIDHLTPADRAVPSDAACADRGSRRTGAARSRSTPLPTTSWRPWCCVPTTRAGRPRSRHGRPPILERSTR